MLKSQGKINVIVAIIFIISNLVGSLPTNRALASQIPKAENDNFTININTQLTISAPGLLINDSNSSKQPLSAIKLTDPHHGTLSLNHDGSFTYTPDLNYSGTESFTYKANDGQDDSNPAIVILTIYPVNDLTKQPNAVAQANGVPSQVIPPSFGITVTPLAPANGATDVVTSPNLSVHITDANNNDLQVSFYGRQKTNIDADNFTLAVIPDTQFYTVKTGGSTYFNAETTWIANNQAAQNIVFVTHTGDITQNGDNDADDSEWVIADSAMSILERDPSTPSDDVPYSISPGNHESLGSVGGVLSRYDAHFPVSRFASKSYYGGHYGTNNDHSYSLFSVGGMHFIMINLACTASAPPSDVLTWAGGLLKDDVSRRGIVVCHNAMDSNGAFSSTGRAVFNALDDNANWFLLLCGHAGNAERVDQGADGHSIYSLEADYEGYPNGGNGYVRLLQFQPANNQIQVMTYSPTLNNSAGGYNTDADSQFIVPYTMQSPDFNLINTVTVSSDSDASVIWYGLANNTQYEWYAVARNPTNNSVGITQSFTTTANPSGTETPTWTSTPGSATLTPTRTFTPTATSTPTPTTTSVSSDFPSTGVLDTFDRVDDAIGTNWAADKSSYKITSNQLVAASNGMIFWKAASFGADQEAYVTFINIIAASTNIDLLLKSQTTTKDSFLEVGYNSTKKNVRVVSYSKAQGYITYAAIPVTFVNGDQLGVRAGAYGIVNIYKNGILLGVRDVSAWTNYASGGYIGLLSWGSTNTIYDNFGGGTLSSVTPTYTATIISSPTFTPTWTNTPTLAATNTFTPTVTSTPTIMETSTFTPTMTSTPIVMETSTFTPTTTSTPTVMETSTFTPTVTSTPALMATSTFTPTTTSTPIVMETSTFTPTTTSTPTVMATSTFTPTTTSTPTVMEASTFTPTVTSTPALMATNTFTPTMTSTPTLSTTSTFTPTPMPGNTGFLSPAMNAAQTGGDGNGYEVNTVNAYANDGLFAVDNNSGTYMSSSCTNVGKDKHRFYNYNITTIPANATVKGIQIRLDAKADSSSISPKLCVQLSWDGGTTWTSAKSTTTLTTTEATYLLGGATDIWGHTWMASQLGNTAFRVHVIDVSISTARDFSLDWVAVQVTYQ